jgi:hypothetical protein
VGTEVTWQCACSGSRVACTPQCAGWRTVPATVGEVAAYGVATLRRWVAMVAEVERPPLGVRFRVGGRLARPPSGAPAEVLARLDAWGWAADGAYRAADGTSVWRITVPRNASIDLRR